MAKRTGVSTLMNLAKHMCRAIVFFTPVIRLAYPGNVLLMAALDAANAACHVLEEELQNVIVAGD